MHHAGCEMPHRCVRRNARPGAFPASSLTDSLRSVVRLRRASVLAQKRRYGYPQNQGIRQKRTCEQKGKGQKKPRSWRFYRLRPPDEHRKNRHSSQRWQIPTGSDKDTGVSPGSSLVRSPVPTLPLTGYLSAFLPSGSVALSHSSRCWYLSSV